MLEGRALRFATVDSGAQELSRLLAGAMPLAGIPSPPGESASPTGRPTEHPSAPPALEAPEPAVHDDGAPPTASAVVRVRDIWYTYGTGAQAIPALRGVSQEIGAGECAALVGRNGSGKTTLAKHLNGLLRPQRGSVEVGGLDTARHDVGRLARVAGYVFQNPDHQLFSRTVREELAFGPRNLGLDGSDIERRVAETLARCGLDALADVPPATLGFAQRRLVAIASVVAMRPSVLALDEPFAGLSWPTVQRLGALLRELAAGGVAVLLITHQMRVVAEYARRCIVLEAGQILADGPAADVLADRRLLERAALVPPAVVRLGERLRPYGFSGRAVRPAAFVEEYRRLRAGSTRSSTGAGEADEEPPA
jgi:energy-coupling factor transport system ATP-binding protein